jgi:hypothetical protein
MATGRQMPTCAAALALRCVGGEDQRSSFALLKGPRSLSDFSRPRDLRSHWTFGPV